MLPATNTPFETKVQVNYQSKGSGAGIRDFQNHMVELVVLEFAQKRGKKKECE